jgi:hypothetical protein
VIERLIENWLANTGERGYETPFAQLLAAEGHTVIQGPVHHPFEHGKDILTYAPNGNLHAYQLEGPDLVNLVEFEKIQGQLLALAGTAITHPSLPQPRRPDHVFLVTNATLTPPVRDRIEKFNLGNIPSGWPPIEPIEREQLLARFIAAHGKYLPQTLPQIRTLLELYYSDPRPLFPVRMFVSYLNDILPFPPQEASIPECRRAIASAVLLTSYAVSSWTRAGNNLGVAQAWLTACIALIRFAAVRNLDGSIWLDSYELALEIARASIASLANEAAEAMDLVVPDLVDGLAYPSRSLLVCGVLSAYFLSERTLAEIDMEMADRIRSVLSRESRFVRLAGESDVPLFFTMACASEQLGSMPLAERMMLSLIRTLSKQNQRHSPTALADPYHDTEQVLLHQIGADSDLDGEEFDGRSYTLHVAIEWAARRLLRPHLADMWPDITRVQFYEFQPSSPEGYLAVDDDEGELKMWFAGQPESWATLLARSNKLDRTKFPNLLWAHREMIPYLPLLLPYRLTAPLSNAIDTIAANPR